MNTLLAPDAIYKARLRTSVRGAIAFARRRQMVKASPVAVDLTLDQGMELLRRQDYRCALTKLNFWSDSDMYRIAQALLANRASAIAAKAARTRADRVTPNAIPKPVLASSASALRGANRSDI